MTAYADLTNDIVSYTENTDTSFAAAIDRFIKNAERRIYSAVNLPTERKNATSSTSIGVQYVEVPEDYVFSYGFSVVHPTDGQQFLLRKEVEYIREMYPLVTYQATPKVYAQFNATNFILGPVPDAVYTVELHYFAFPETVVTAGDTWLTTNYYQLVLYGALLEANIWMKSSKETLDKYFEAYKNDLATLIKYSGERIANDDYRQGTVT